jgi:uncharacterized protein
MSRPGIIPDPFRFAAEGRTLSRRVALADLPRLADVLLENDGQLSYELSGESGVDGVPFLRLTASAVLKLRCQRCLNALDWPLELESLLQLAMPGAPIPDEELEIEAFDTIEAVADMDVLALLEDEILLTVPIAPRHECCDAPRPTGVADKESPFAALATLRKKPGAQ